MRGFPEFLLNGQIVEQQVVATLRHVFELHGFGSLETRVVEPLETLLKKGETDKEIYLLRRLQADSGDSESGIGLHFDLTVPLARFVTENAGRLPFPLRAYQIQKVWRGERPQEGRYREFRQADIDVIGRDDLPAHHEAELPVVVADALRRLPLPPLRIQVNNRKLMEGFFRGVGIGDPHTALRAVDKLDKIGPAAVHQLLTDGGTTAKQADACLELAGIRTVDSSFVDRVRVFGVVDDLLDTGLAELSDVIDAGIDLEPGLFVADLRIARGLDYYTGTVYETQLIGHESIGSICSGGRYDDLAGTAGGSYPGVGLSIGVTRLLGRLLGKGMLRSTRDVPTCVLVAVADEARRRASTTIASRLRARGIAAEVAPSADRYGRQIRYADRRGIPFVWFPAVDGGNADSVRDIRSGEQVDADADTWTPPADDLTPRLEALPQP
jgi:histidyl-tRNA synthetase